VRLFHARFEPDTEPDPGAEQDALARVRELLDDVAGLDADRILRGYLTAMLATLRTNYFLRRSYLSLKFDPAAIPEMPAPRPRFEISCTRRGWRACTCGSGRWRGAGCAGRTAPPTTGPRCWGWSRRRR